MRVIREEIKVNVRGSLRRKRDRERVVTDDLMRGREGGRERGKEGGNIL